MSFAYSSIGLGLAIAKIAGGTHVQTSLTGVRVGVDVTASEKVFRTFQSIGDIAFSHAFSTVLVEIQDTLKSSPPENKSMKRATLAGISTTTVFYILCGTLGYAAFGKKAPGNFLTGFGFYEPFWLIDLANVCIAVHLVGAYQVFCQPLFGFIEGSCHKIWPENKFLTKEYPIEIPACGVYNLNFFRLVWRTAYVIFTTVLAMLLPFFNDFLGFLGACSFWRLSVYFPIEMYIKRAKIQRFCFGWICLKTLTLVCLILSLLAAGGSIEGLIASLKTYKPFQTPDVHE